MALVVDCQYSTPQGFTLSAAFAAGDGITALWGPSGSGKTTLLNLVAGLLRPDRGRVVLDDQELSSPDVFVPPEARGVGVVFQDNLLFPHLRVTANLHYGQKRRPVQPLDFDRVVKVLELHDLLERYPATLSGGQARRVAIGRALLRGPRVLLLDEPWTGLDEPLKARVTDLVQRCRAEWDIPLLVASHDAEQVDALGARRLTLSQGRLEGPPAP